MPLGFPQTLRAAWGLVGSAKLPLLPAGDAMVGQSAPLWRSNAQSLRMAWLACSRACLAQGQKDVDGLGIDQRRQIGYFLAFTALLIAAGTVLGPGNSFAQKSKIYITGDDVSGHTTDKSIVKFNLNGRQFDVPKNYLWFRSHWFGQSPEGGTETKQISFKVTAGEYLPYSKETAVDFTVGSHPSKVISFDVRVSQNTFAVSDNFIRSGEIKKCKVWQANFVTCHKSKFLNFVQIEQEAYLDTNNLKEKIIICLSNKGSIKVKNYFCNLYFQFSPGLSSKIRFERSLLPISNEIFFEIKKILTSFSNHPLGGLPAEKY